MKVNVLILLLLFNSSLFCVAKAGNKVDGAKVSLFQPSNQEYYAMIHTNDEGEFAFFDIAPGNYFLTISIPKRVIVDNLEERKILENLIEGGCNKSEGRMVFKIKDQCFFYDINCEYLTAANFIPSFKIIEEGNVYLITIASAELTKTTLIKGLFQSISAKNFKRCLESGKFQLINEDDPIH